MPGSPPSTGTFRMWALGDPGSGTSAAQAVLAAYLRTYSLGTTDLMLQLGDNAVRHWPLWVSRHLIPYCDALHE